jgi:hypothetical protein
VLKSPGTCAEGIEHRAWGKHKKHPFSFKKTFRQEDDFGNLAIEVANAP